MIITGTSATTFYLDESGNSGDLARPGSALDFGSQQIFTLGCVGLSDLQVAE